MRWEHRRARQNLNWAQKRAKEVDAAKGQQKGKRKGERLHGASEHKRLRLLHEMAFDEQWYVKSLWSGHLHREVKKGAGGPVQADDFYVRDED